MILTGPTGRAYNTFSPQLGTSINVAFLGLFYSQAPISQHLKAVSLHLVALKAQMPRMLGYTSTSTLRTAWHLHQDWHTWAQAGMSQSSSGPLSRACSHHSLAHESHCRTLFRKACRCRRQRKWIFLGQPRHSCEAHVACPMRVSAADLGHAMGNNCME